jgi:hypothetical protein
MLRMIGVRSANGMLLVDPCRALSPALLGATVQLGMHRRTNLHICIKQRSLESLEVLAIGICSIFGFCGSTTAGGFVDTLTTDLL